MNRIHFGHQKCGCRFFRNMVLGKLAREQGWPVIAYRIENPPFHFSHPADLDGQNFAFHQLAGPDPKVANFGNSTPRELEIVSGVNPDFRATRAIRDLRQVLVSSYFHHLKGHWTRTDAWVWDKLEHDRPILERLPVEEGLLYELDNLGGMVIRDEILGWPDDPRILTVRLEDMDADRDGLAERLGAHLDVARMPVIEWDRKFAETGSSRWDAYFTPRLKSAFKDRFGEALVDLGYASDLDW